MKTYVVGYDLNKPRSKGDYQRLIDAIKSYGTWWHHLDSTWIIKTDQTTVEIRNFLTPFLDSGDELLVAHLESDWATYGINDAGVSWLDEEMTLE